MSGLGRSHQSYPEETGHLNSTCQKLYKYTHSHRAFADISLHLFHHTNSHFSKEKMIEKFYIFVSKDEHGIEKISQTVTRQSGRPAVAAVTNKEASSSISQSDTSRVFYGWNHRGMICRICINCLSANDTTVSVQITMNYDIKVSIFNTIFIVTT